MVKYSSRVNNVYRTNKKMTTTGDESSHVPGDTEEVDTSLPAGGSLSTGGTISTGGRVRKSAVKKVAKVVKAAVSKQLGHVLPIGGTLRTGGAILQPHEVDDIQYPMMVYALGMMDMPTYYMLQGLAAAHLGMNHPLATPTRHALGGDFVHPKFISRVATRDILKSTTPQHLSQALYNEWMDSEKGSPVGGGLFDSLKMLVRKGVSGGKRALSALATGAKSAVKFLQTGAMAGQMIGRSLSNAIEQGIEVANVLAPAVSQVSSRAGSQLERGVSAASRARQAVNRGTDAASQAASILSALGPINAPLVGTMGTTAIK